MAVGAGVRIEQVGQATLINADCREAMALLDENSVDSIVTDPPYELTSARPGGRSPATKGKVRGGFMGMKWDGTGIANDPAVWAAALRVAKPGAYLLAFGGTRTFHRLACAIEDAGWELRDTIMWVYGSGFPKSHNGPWGGTALKPAHEPVILARKPLIGTVAENVQQFGTGGLNIDGCRIGTTKNVPASVSRGTGGHSFGGGVNGTLRHEDGTQSGHDPNIGRWPANLIHDGSDEVLECFPETASGKLLPHHNKGGGSIIGTFKIRNRKDEPGSFGGDTGSAARFFYCAKASKADRDEGLENMPDKIVGMSNAAQAAATRGEHYDNGDGGVNQTKMRENNHPTVKPTALMQYLCRLVTPPNGVVLDPFMGSGSTGKACALEGFQFVGIDNDTEHGYFDIALARCAT